MVVDGGPECVYLGLHITPFVMCMVDLVTFKPPFSPLAGTAIYNKAQDQSETENCSNNNSCDPARTHR